MNEAPEPHFVNGYLSSRDASLTRFLGERHLLQRGKPAQRSGSGNRHPLALSHHLCGLLRFLAHAGGLCNISPRLIVCGLFAAIGMLPKLLLHVKFNQLFQKPCQFLQLPPRFPIFHRILSHQDSISKSL
ncbi:hypothetical protein Riv7116_4502 [Rivularia sp. PCC 7116]|nr:hypothetical protein Riv7116_4502 [Rivularia sp. PCC 7116]